MVLRGQDPYEQIQEKMDQLNRDVRAIKQQPFLIPVLDADPDVAQGNAWLLNDGRLRVRNASGTVKEYAPVGSPGGTTTTVAKPAPPPAKKTYVKTWGAQWTQAYRDTGAQRTDYGDTLIYGYSDSFNGRNTSLIGFDYNNIASTLSGATVTKVELYFHQLHAWWNWGAYVRFGMHSNTVKPGTYGSIVQNNMSQVTYGKPQAKWAVISTAFGTRWRNGTAKGISIDPLTNDKAYYGRAAGITGAGNPPQVRITYVK